jgi:hypothetical protein
MAGTPFVPRQAEVDWSLLRELQECRGSVTQQDTTMPRKRVQESWNALDLLARDSMRDFEELADEALRRSLQKHGRPVDLKTTLRQSVGEIEKQPPTPSVRRRDGSRKARRGE